MVGNRVVDNALPRRQSLVPSRCSADVSGQKTCLYVADEQTLRLVGKDGRHMGGRRRGGRDRGERGRMIE